MADSQITTVTNLDIQLLDADRSNATTIKLDNPKNTVTRELVSVAMQPALTNGWFLCTNGNTAMYLGDITINQSIKTKLGGDDFYVTPTSISLTFTDLDQTETSVIEVSGAAIQGVNITDIVDENEAIEFLSPQIAENGLSVSIKARSISASGDSPVTFKVNLIILGTSVTVNGTATVSV